MCAVKLATLRIRKYQILLPGNSAVQGCDALSRQLWEDRRADFYTLTFAFYESSLWCAQEAAKLMPGSYWHLSLCSKAWSDVTYLDEVQSKFREPLTVQMKREVNEKALQYSSKVPSCALG